MKNQKRYRDGVDGGILDNNRIRILIIALIMLTMLTVLAMRLYYIQLYHGEEHRQRIANQSIQRIRIPGWRGSIYTLDNMLVAGNHTTYDLLFYPEEMRTGGRARTIDAMFECAKKIARAIGREDFPDLKVLRRHLYISPGMPLTAFKALTPQECAKALEVSRSMRGVELQTSAQRIYPAGKMAAPLIGYARQAEESRAEDREDFFYYRPDMIGKSGVEAAFDSLDQEAGTTGLGLRAYPGRQVVQVNNFGFVHKELLGKVEPIHGNNVTLTIDSKAQKLAERLLAPCTGAMVVVDADNGDIICAATAPTYDLSKFSPYLSPEYYNELLKDPRRPLINRALNGIYPPGSTLKPLISLALLKSGVDPKAKLECQGRTEVAGVKINCQAHRYGGVDIDMETALEKSCNSYMIINALKCGLPTIADLLHSAGIGTKTGVEIRDSSGTFPSSALKKKRYGLYWNDYDTALLSIGQGLIAVTPLQMALYTAALANGGIIYQPHLVYQVSDQHGTPIIRREPIVRSKLDTTAEHLEIVKHGMFKVVNSHGGSGRRGAVENLKIYGKTGTAELGSRNKMRNITHFICFVEYRGRRYAASVTIEDGSSGGQTCAPLAAAFFDHYLSPSPTDE